MFWPPDFEAQMKEQLGPEWPAFQEALSTPAPVSIRVNPLKPGPKLENAEKVKWCTDGAYLPERPVFTLDPLFHAGTYYVQEASSMFLAEAVRQSVDLSRPLRVLDLCAAPGGKSTLLLSLLNPESWLLANEVIRSRYQILKYNLVKWGYPNVIAANRDSRHFTGLAGFFDLVVVDAPCSGEGLFRKDAAAMDEWSTDNVALCTGRQKRILAEAAPLVRPGGVLIYSTCTYNELENEENVRWLRSQFAYRNIELKIPADWGIVEKPEGYRFYPHRVQGEGLFMTCLRKESSESFSGKTKTPLPKGLTPLPRRELEQVAPWLNQPETFSLFSLPGGNILAFPRHMVEDLGLLSRALGHVEGVLTVGALKKKDLAPAPELALSTAIAKELPAVSFSKEEALNFLRKDNPDPAQVPRGWVLASYEGHALGWMKGLGNRVNNYYPKEWRIRMEVR